MTLQERATLTSLGQVASAITDPASTLRGPLVNIIRRRLPAAATIAAINSAITDAAADASGPRVVRVPNGVYAYSGTPLTIGASNVTVEFEPGAEIDAASVASGQYAVQVQGTGVGATISVTVDVARGAGTLTLSSTSGLAAGDRLVLRSSDLFDAGRSLTRSEFVTVASVDSATQITLLGLTADAYLTASTCVVQKLTAIDGVRVEGLTLVGGGAGLNQTGMLVRYATGVKLAGLTIDGIDKWALTADFCDDFSLSDFTISNTSDSDDSIHGFAVFLQGVQNGRISHGFGRHNHHLIDIASEGTSPRARDIVVSDCIGIDGLRPAFSTHPGAENVTFANCIARGNGGGFVTRGKFCTITGGAVETITGGGYASGVQIGDGIGTGINHGYGIGGTGLVIDGLTIDVTCASPPGDIHAIRADCPLEGARMENLILRGFTRHGFLFRGHHTTNLVLRNILADCSLQTSSGASSDHFINVQPTTYDTAYGVHTGVVIEGLDLIGGPRGRVLNFDDKGGGSSGARNSFALRRVRVGGTPTVKAISVNTGSGYFDTLDIDSVFIPTITRANLHDADPSKVTRLLVTRATCSDGTYGSGGPPVGSLVVTANYTALLSDHLLLANNSSAAITITLPAAAACSGQEYVVKRLNTQDVVLDGNGSETIDGAATKTLTAQYSAVRLRCNGSAWHILAQMGTVS